MQKIYNNLKNIITNYLGWHTDRKIIVFESDDWGSIRVPDKRTLKVLKDAGINVDNCRYMLNDSLESNDDLEALFNVINEKKIKPVITANFLTANPDFDKIKASGYSNYYNEPLEATLSRYNNHNKVKEYWLLGNEAGIFRPQLHGREHLNISRWMTDLQNGNEETQLAFNLQTYAVSGHIVKEKRRSYLAAFDSGSGGYLTDPAEIITDSVIQFEELFKFKPTTFIAPNYIWGEEVEKTTSNMGITHLQGTRSQLLPRDINGKHKIKRHFLGDKNKYGQKYLIRNCTFEPYFNSNKDWVNSCMKDINSAFTMRKPAIITMHRVNFIGSINQNNRENTLKSFSELINQIIKKWPDVEFMSSDTLAKLIK